jgi:alpha-1,3-glucan synthase
MPGHDERIQSPVKFGEQTTLPIQVRFSSEMDCDSVIGSLEIDSTSYYGLTATLNRSSIKCTAEKSDPPPYIGAIGGAWSFSATLNNVTDGIHTITVNNATATDGSFTNVSLHSRRLDCTASCGTRKYLDDLMYLSGS